MCNCKPDFAPKITTSTGTATAFVETELTEHSRVYTFAGDSTVRINKPRSIFVSPSGNHRIKDDLGNLHIVAPGWLHIEIDDGGKDWTL